MALVSLIRSGRILVSVAGSKVKSPYVNHSVKRLQQRTLFLDGRKNVYEAHSQQGPKDFHGHSWFEPNT
jgi:hypothetical protein